MGYTWGGREGVRGVPFLLLDASRGTDDVPLLNSRYLDARVEVRTLGGHSSVPPEHTVRGRFLFRLVRVRRRVPLVDSLSSSFQSIGLLSLLVSEIERNPHLPILTRESPVYELLQCQAAFATLSSPKLDLVLGSAKSDKKLKALEKLIVQDKGTRSQLRTTTAVDLISGGVKVSRLSSSLLSQSTSIVLTSLTSRLRLRLTHCPKS